MYDIIIIRYTSNGKDYEADVHKHYPIHHFHMAIRHLCNNHCLHFLLEIPRTRNIGFYQWVDKVN